MLRLKRMAGLQIQTTSVCNGKCLMCPYLGSWFDKNPGIMPESTFDMILDQVQSIKFDRICPYLMNEPLADPKIFERIEKVKRMKNFNYIQISTNAYLLDEKRSNELISCLHKTKNEIWISFHGISKTSYKHIMGIDFDKVMNNIHSFLENASDKLNICIRGTGQPFIAKNDSTGWFTKNDYLNFWDNKFKEWKLKKRPKVYFFEYNDRAGNVRRDLSFNTARKSLKGFSCHRIDKWLHFAYTGELVLCCNDYNKQYVLGDIMKQTLTQILNSNKWKYTKDMIEGRIESPEDFICKSCDKHSV
jgi:MoaA/NifB/PqqE/SkfB family radical SAM enzyme